MGSAAQDIFIPMTVGGGMGSPEHLVQVVQEGKADAVAMADVLHYKRFSMPQIRAAAQAAHIPVRRP